MRRALIHPWLFAAYPVLYLWSINVAEVAGPGDVWPALAASLTVTTLLLLACRVVFRSWSKAAVATSLLVALVFSYGHVWRAIDGADVTEAGGRDFWLLGLWTLLAVAGLVAVWRAREPLSRLNRVLTVVATVLVVLAGMSVLTGSLGGGAAEAGPPPDVPGPVTVPVADIADRGRLPDIFLLVFDRYGGEATLERTYRFDNTPFLSHLEERGFYVAHGSYGNYPNTAHSLAGSLNLGYLDHLTESAGAANGDWEPVYSMVSDNEVGRFLEDLGYRQVQIPSWWEPTRQSSTADVILAYDPLSEFSRLLLNTTALRAAAVHLGLAADVADPRLVEWNRVRYQLDQIAAVPRNGDEPVFVFAHVLLPHHPYVFDAEGAFQTQEDEEALTPVERYVGQVEYANLRIEELVDDLLAGPGEQPIVLIQSDEGPAPRPRRNAPPPPGDDTPYWLTYSDDQLSQKFGILNTFYLPGQGDAGLYQSISPVNNFRVLFNTYFGTDLPLLDDRSYVWTDRAHLYEFNDVTDRLRR